MEADIISCNEVVDNKENIPPNSSLKEIVLQDRKLSAANGRKFKRKFRSPLTDITNLFLVGQSDLGLHSSAALKNCRKRKAVAAASASHDHIDIDWKHNTSSKILRKGFR